MEKTEVTNDELENPNEKQLEAYKKEPLESEDMEQKIKTLGKFIDSKKGEDISILDLRKIHSYLSFFLIVSASSILHAKSLVRDIRKNLTELEIEKYMSLDDRSPDWIVIDCIWLVIHIFTPNTREFFGLEKLWADARVVHWEDK